MPTVGTGRDFRAYRKSDSTQTPVESSFIKYRNAGHRRKVTVARSSLRPSDRPTISLKRIRSKALDPSNSGKFSLELRTDLLLGDGCDDLVLIRGQPGGTQRGQQSITAQGKVRDEVGVRAVLAILRTTGRHEGVPVDQVEREVVEQARVDQDMYGEAAAVRCRRTCGGRASGLPTLGSSPMARPPGSPRPSAPGRTAGRRRPSSTPAPRRSAGSPRNSKPPGR